MLAKALADRLKELDIKALVATLGLASTHFQVTTNKRGGMGDRMQIMRLSQSAEDDTMPLAAACFGKSSENGDF